MPRVCGVLQMKEVDVLIPATGIQFRWHQPWSPDGASTKRSDGLCSINLKRPWEKFLVPWAVFACGCFCHPLRSPGQQDVQMFATATGATPIAGGFPPGTFTGQIQAAFREPRLLVMTDPRAYYQPHIEASYASLPTMLHVTQILLCTVCTLLPQAAREGNSLSVSDVVEPDLGSSVLAPSPVSTRGGPCLIQSTSAETPRI